MSQPPSNTNVGILAAAIYPTLGAIRAARAPLVQHFAHVLGHPGLFRFVPLDTSVDDGWTVIVPSGGGGAWLLERVDDRGLDLVVSPAPVLVGVAGGRWRVLAAASLVANTAFTLDPTGAERGDTIEVTREDLTAYAATWANGGPASGTLSTMAGGAKAFALFWFDGTDWMQRRGGVMP